MTLSNVFWPLRVWVFSKNPFFKGRRGIQNDSNIDHVDREWFHRSFFDKYKENKYIPASCFGNTFCICYSRRNVRLYIEFSNKGAKQTNRYLWYNSLSYREQRLMSESKQVLLKRMHFERFLNFWYQCVKNSLNFCPGLVQHL
jgi:hypothetical protein